MIINAELDITPAFGWQGGPEFSTLTKRSRSGRERRKPLWDDVKHHYILPFQNITDAAYLTKLKSVFLSSMGSAHSFRVRDFSDYRADGEVFALGDGVETDFTLGISASFGDASYFRRILWPTAESVYFANGSPVAASFDYATGLLEFAVAPAAGAVLSWTGEFRVLVRFVSDNFPMTIDDRSGQNFAMNGSIELMEVYS